VARSPNVLAMNPDVMITIFFALEVFLFGIVAMVAVAGGLRKAAREAAAESERDRGETSAERIVSARRCTTANKLARTAVSPGRSGRAGRGHKGVRR
jgi:hypothetical protein